MKYDSRIDDTISILSGKAGASSDSKDYSEETLSDGDILVSLVTEDKFDKGRILSSLDDITRKGSRIPYHSISEYVYRKQDEPERIDKLMNRIAMLKGELSSSEGKGKQEEILGKMLDHIQLASLQIQKFSEIVALQREYMEKESRDIEEARRDNNTQIVSILSIFTAVAFVLFGGISGLAGLFSLLGDASCSVGKIVAGVAIYGLMMAGIVLLLSFCVSRIIRSADSKGE